MEFFLNKLNLQKQLSPTIQNQSSGENKQVLALFW